MKIAPWPLVHALNTSNPALLGDKNRNVRGKGNMGQSVEPIKADQSAIEAAYWLAYQRIQQKPKRGKK